MARGTLRSPVRSRLLTATVAVLTVGGITAGTGIAVAGQEANGYESPSGLDGHENRAEGAKSVWDKIVTEIFGGNSSDGGSEDDDDADDEEEFPGRDEAGGPFRDDFVDIQDVEPNGEEPRNKRDASTGSFTSVCGTNEEQHQNSDNYMQAPGKVNAAQHVHDYVGNVSTDAFSNDENLAAADTTCQLGDQSTYFWPVLRDTDKEGDDADDDGGGLDGNVGEILTPTGAELEFRGSPVGPVEEMPQFLRLIVGDARAATNGEDADVQSQWTCTGFEDRTTTKYPLCPRGSDLVRIFDFPSCWDGKNLDSEDHKSHIVFPGKDGSCEGDTVAVPQLRITLTYQQPDNGAFALDSFPEQQHDPRTDHGQFENLMPEDLMGTAVECINQGQTC